MLKKHTKIIACSERYQNTPYIAISRDNEGLMRFISCCSYFCLKTQFLDEFGISSRFLPNKTYYMNCESFNWAKNVKKNEDGNIEIDDIFFASPEKNKATYFINVAKIFNDFKDKKDNSITISNELLSKFLRSCAHLDKNVSIKIKNTDDDLYCSAVKDEIKVSTHIRKRNDGKQSYFNATVNPYYLSLCLPEDDKELVSFVYDNRRLYLNGARFEAIVMTIKQ
jgi:hypothetical protein